MKIDGMLDRKCCELCGFCEEPGFSLFSDEGECPACGYEFDDYAFLHPDEQRDGESSLNLRRFNRFVLNKEQSIFDKLFRGSNYAAGYKLWRKLHPELSGRFDMSEFKEKPEFFEQLMSMKDYFGEE